MWTKADQLHITARVFTLEQVLQFEHLTHGGACRLFMVDDGLLENRFCACATYYAESDEVLEMLRADVHTIRASVVAAQLMISSAVSSRVALTAAHLSESRPRTALSRLQPESWAIARLLKEQLYFCPTFKTQQRGNLLWIV